MKTKPTILLMMAALALPLSAKDIDWAQRAKDLNDENSRRFRERQFHDEIVKQQERIHRESVTQRERIADDNRRQLERIERRIPDYRQGRDYYVPARPIFPIR
jgi:hypothetical protein